MTDDPPLADWEKALTADPSDPDAVWTALGTTDEPWTFGFDGTPDGDLTIAAATRTADGHTVVHWVKTYTDVDLDPWQVTALRQLFDAKTDDVRALAAAAATPRLTWPRHTFRGFDDVVNGRVHHDELHPDNRLEWQQTVEGLTADGHPQPVCEHCGEPVPCVENVLRHMDTDLHRTYCRPTGFCIVAERMIRDLPSRT
jgi:hypothetical protein